jgi:DNA-binding transcriptional regulator YhcF (GntR family)
MLLQYRIKGSNAGQIASSVETGLLRGNLRPGEQLPAVRSLAARLRVSPATVASAYRLLQNRGLVTADGRRGTTVSPRPPLTSRAATRIAANVRDL